MGGAITTTTAPPQADRIGAKALRRVLQVIGVGEPADIAELGAGSGWGLLAHVCLTASVGLLLIAIAQAGGWHNSPWSETTYWIGTAAIMLPAATRIAWPRVARRERLGLVLLLGLALYAVKILYSPIRFAHFDEFLHWATAIDIMDRQHLFTSNSLLPISPLYPALEILTTALANLSGMSIFASGMLLLAVGRVVFLSAMFLLFEGMTRSSRVAALACAVFMAGSNFSLFEAQFAYESLAFVLLALVLLTDAQMKAAHETAERSAGAGLWPVAALLLLALAATHHLTAYFAALFFTLLAVLEALHPRSPDVRRRVAFALLSVLAAFGWSSAMGNPTAGYVGPVFEQGFQELYRLLSAHGPARVPFVGEDGIGMPRWQRGTALTAMVLVCVGLVTGFFRALAVANLRLLVADGRRWKIAAPGFDSAAVLLTLLTLAFPLSVLLRLTKSGWEIGSRLETYAYLGIGLVVAVAIAVFWQGPSQSRARAAGVAAAMAIMLMGGAILGWAPFAVASRYKVSADSLSIEPVGIDAAEWTRRWLGSGNRFATDRINRLLLATYGRQIPVTTLQSGIDTSHVLFAAKIASDQLDAIHYAGIDYLLVDMRLTSALPTLGVYFEGGEDADIHASPPAASALLKFNALRQVGRPFDNGMMVIYDVRSLHAPH